MAVMYSSRLVQVTRHATVSARFEVAEMKRAFILLQFLHDSYDVAQEKLQQCT